MRRAFITALGQAAAKDKRIILITGDLGYRILEPFAERFPDRFLNIGVAEANLVTVAAGLSTAGYIPFIYSIATFATLRPFEQIRNDIALQRLNVKIVGIGAGFAYTKAGPTHHSLEDIALMRTLPGMTIVAPADPPETYSAVGALVGYRGPCYLRLERNPDKPHYSKPPRFHVGKAVHLRKGTKVAILLTGTKVELAMTVAERLAQKKVAASVYAFPTIAPLDTKALDTIASSHRVIATLEEHFREGGFGSSVLEYVSGLPSPVRVLRYGMEKRYVPYSANYETLCRINHFTAGLVTRSIVAYLAHRRGEK